MQTRMSPAHAFHRLAQAPVGEPVADAFRAAQQPGPAFGHSLPLEPLAKALPFTYRVLPISLNNLSYLARVTILTRALTAVARMAVTYPANLKKILDTKKPDNPVEALQQDIDMKLAFWERVFVEVFDTGAFVTALHLTQDIFSKLSQRAFAAKLKVPQFNEATLAAHHPQVAEAIAHLSPQKQQQALSALRKAVHQTFGEPNLIYRALLPDLKDNTTMAYLTHAEHKLSTALKAREFDPATITRLSKALMENPALHTLQKRTNWLAGLTLTAAALIAGPLFTGVFVQYLSDNLWSKAMRPRVRAGEIKKRNLTEKQVAELEAQTAKAAERKTAHAAATGLVLPNQAANPVLAAATRRSPAFLTSELAPAMAPGALDAQIQTFQQTPPSLATATVTTAASRLGTTGVEA